MFQFSRRNTGENATPAATNQSQSKSGEAGSPRRPTLEQLMLNLDEGAAMTTTIRTSQPAREEAVPPVEHKMESPPRPEASTEPKPVPFREISPSKQVPPVKQQPVPLGYRPSTSAAKLTQAGPAGWNGVPNSPSALQPGSVHQPIRPVHTSMPSVNLPVNKPELRQPTPQELLPDLVRTAEHAVPSEISEMLPLELIAALKATADKSNIHHRLQQYCKHESHNPLLELPSGMVAFIALEDNGTIKVFVGNMRDFSLFCVRTNMLDGTLPLEEMYEYREAGGDIQITRKRANEIGPSQIAGRKMFPVLQFMSYTIAGYGKATYQIKSEWR